MSSLAPITQTPILHGHALRSPTIIEVKWFKEVNMLVVDLDVNNS